MLKYILHTFKATLGVLVTASLLMSCETDSDTSEPTPEASATRSTFSLVDSIQVDARFQNTHPEAYQNLRGKTYSVTAQDKLEAYYLEENNGVTLYFRDTSGVHNRSWVSIHFKNRGLQNLPEFISLKDANTVCVHNGQNFSDGSGAMSPGCVTVLDGTATLQYNPATHVLTGTVANLKLQLEYYVPDYSFPNRTGNVLKESGSSRNLNLSFENVKGRKAE